MPNKTPAEECAGIVRVHLNTSNYQRGDPLWVRKRDQRMIAHCCGLVGTKNVACNAHNDYLECLNVYFSFKD